MARSFEGTPSSAGLFCIAQAALRPRCRPTAKRSSTGLEHRKNLGGGGRFTPSWRCWSKPRSQSRCVTPVRSNPYGPGKPSVVRIASAKAPRTAVNFMLSD